MKRISCSFAADEQVIQERYFAEHFPAKVGHRGRAFQLRPEHRFHGLLEPLRQTAPRVFKELGIQWHSFIGHGRSSQACCVNFLMPFADQPELLSRWIGHVLGISPPQMLPLEREAVDPFRYVAFEYTGPGDFDYLGEAEGAVPQRGAHATAADAAVAFVGADGQRELLLIEWKYSEEYRNHRLGADVKGKRLTRYGDKAFAPSGPIRDDLGLQLTDFFKEPFYQLLRQQMLAWQIEHHTQQSGMDRARVLHLSPAGNRALHQVTSPAFANLAGEPFDDAFAAFRAALVRPDTFIERSIEQAFAPLAQWPEASWHAALAERYPSLVPVETETSEI